MKYTYYRLLDRENKGTIVRAWRLGSEKYDENSGEWVPMDMWDYYFSMVDESPYFEDDYERISEEEALEAIRKPGG